MLRKTKEVLEGQLAEAVGVNPDGFLRIGQSALEPRFEAIERLVKGRPPDDKDRLGRELQRHTAP